MSRVITVCIAALMTLILGLALVSAPLSAQSTENETIRTIPVTGIAPRTILAPDGQIIALYEDATINEDDVGDPARLGIQIIDLSSGELLVELRGETDYVADLAFSPDSETVVAYYRNGFVYQWDATTGEVLRRIPTLAGSAEGDIQLTPDGTTVALVMAGYPAGIALVNLETGYITSVLMRRFDSYAASYESVLAGPPATFQDFAFSPDGAQIALATGRGEVWQWDVASSEATILKSSTEQFPQFNIRQVTFSGDGEQVVYYDTQQKSIHKITLVTGDEEPIIVVNDDEEVTSYPATFALANDDTRIAWMGNDRLLHVAPLADPMDTQMIELPPTNGAFVPNISTLTFTPDDAAIVIGGLVNDDRMNTDSAVLVVSIDN